MCLAKLFAILILYANSHSRDEDRNTIRRYVHKSLAES